MRIKELEKEIEILSLELQLLEIEGQKGGPGSGCHGEACGRPRGSSGGASSGSARHDRAERNLEKLTGHSKEKREKNRDAVHKASEEAKSLINSRKLRDENRRESLQKSHDAMLKAAIAYDRAHANADNGTEQTKEAAAHYKNMVEMTAVVKDEINNIKRNYLTR